MQLIKITNSGPQIASTNYWRTAQARAGLLFLSWNAGAGRLLVPAAAAAMLPEMETAREVIVSRGPWSAQDGREALELLFEDGTDTPFSAILVAEQCDRLLPDTDQGGGFVVAVWTEAGKQREFPGRYRRVEALPCLSPWIEHG